MSIDDLVLTPQVPPMSPWSLAVCRLQTCDFMEEKSEGNSTMSEA